MKCKKCGQHASVNMPHHHMGLCKAHYLEWIPEQVERSIIKYGMFKKSERILVAVSGGKDSLSLWDILRRLDYQADGLYICLGIPDNDYSRESQRFCEKYGSDHGLRLHVVNLEAETGKTIPELASVTQRGREKPCSVCGLIKRHTMNRMSRDYGYDVLVTGHNLDDEVAALFGNILTWSEEYLLRQGPVLPEIPGMARKAKPMCRLYERETTAYALLRGIEYIYEECPYSVDATSIRYKDLFTQLEHAQPGAKLSFYLKFLKARQDGFFSNQPDLIRELHPCEKCGQPTSANGKCSYCRMLERADAAKEPE